MFLLKDIQILFYNPFPSTQQLRALFPLEWKNLMPFLRNKALLLLLDVLALLLCVAGVEQSRLKGGLHAELKGEYSSSIAPDSISVASISKMEQILRPGDVILRVDGYPLHEVEDVEQVLDTRHAGSDVTITYRRDGVLKHTTYTLASFYSPTDIVIQSGGVLIFFALAFFVLSRRPSDTEALLFHHLAITVAGVIALTHGYFMMEPEGLGHLLRALLPSIYAFLGTLILHFSLVFPRPRPVSRTVLSLMYIPCVILTVVGLYTSYRATLPFDLAHAGAYFGTLTVTRVFMVVCSGIGIAIMLRTFQNTRDAIIRKQIAWVVFGVGFSILVYLLWQLGSTQYVTRLLPAEYNRLVDTVRLDESILILSLVLTGSFISIGIIRYRFFDIEFFFRRGTVITLVVASLSILFALILYAAMLLLTPSTAMGTYLLAILTLLPILLLFIPVRSLVQKSVDRWFFRVEYDFRKSLTSISRDIEHSVEPGEVAEAIVRGIDGVMHLHGAMVLLVREDRHLDVMAKSGFRRWNSMGLTVHPERLQDLPSKPIVLANVMENGCDVEEMRMEFADRFGVVMLFTIREEAGEVLGLIVLGNKRTGTRFTIEDMDMLHSITTQAGLHLQRLRLQEKLLLEKSEAARLRELSQMKSFFVSGVSHDLKTPLTSIKLFSELLEQQLPEDDASSRKYVGIMQGECDRLGRLINNVLDFTRIERGMMKYHFDVTELNVLAQRAYDVMQYQFSVAGFSCICALDDAPLLVEADADAMIEAVTNLLSNAMKYSGTSRRIELRTERRGSHAMLKVIDEGLGIDEQDIAHLFEPFFRSRSGAVQEHGGVGLGLALVKHIVDAHRGEIHVDSTPGGGSTFTITLHLVEEA